jgi:thiol:disulfide interchange protein/DsbC/DsbD-like thiol-disulfide interchange protein
MKVVVAAALAAVLSSFPAHAAPRAADLVRADLVAEPQAITAGEPFTVGVRLRMKEHWHTYWRNPGDSGLATTVTWTLPPGFSAGPIQWPTPARIPVTHLVNYGYEGETVLLAEITPPADLSGGQAVDLRADLAYLVCERECIPGEASLSLRLPTVAGMSAAPNPSLRPVFAAARASLPRPVGWPVQVGEQADNLVLRITAPGEDFSAVTSAYLFPYGETAIDHAAEQTLTSEPGALSLKVARSSMAASAPADGFGGVLVLEDGAGRRAFAVGKEPPAASAPTLAAPVPSGQAERSLPVADTSLASIVQSALLAFLGGLILNLMPCVFPVLSIKVLSLVRHSGEPARRIRLHGTAYTLGVVASFLALAGILLAVRAGGQSLGWGFQLQSPVIVALLAYLLFAMGLSLQGAIEFGAALGGVGAGLASRGGLPGSFFTGVLATIVATPCTAPFMGAAVGLALTASVPVALAIFLALGLGMALPFLVLTLAPGLVARLPRPGAWMVRLKQVLAFPLYATVAWLVFVLSQQVAPDMLFLTLIGFVLLGLAAWLFGTTPSSTGWGRTLGSGGTAASVAGLVAILALLGETGPSGRPSQVAAAPGVEPFSQARLADLRAEGRPVFVNLTAAWCITCLVNERTTLSSAAVKDAFAARRVAYMKGDWTNQDPEITRLLTENGRSGVPLYLLYSGQEEAMVLPQILSEATVLDALARLGEGPAGKRAALEPTTRKE